MGDTLVAEGAGECRILSSIPGQSGGGWKTTAKWGGGEQVGKAWAKTSPRCMWGHPVGRCPGGTGKRRG